MTRFPFAFTPAHRLAARPFGIGPDTAEVEVTRAALIARYGRWRVVTPLGNLAEVEITGPYLFLKTAGPPRLAITDRGLTFASNSDRGVRIGFRRPVAGIEPTRLLTHPELTVTVADVEALAALLRGRAGLA